MHFEEQKMDYLYLPPSDLYSLQPPLELISDHKIMQLNALSQKYYDLQTKFKRQPFFTRQQYYLLSSQWMRRWKLYVGYEQLIHKKPPHKYLGCGKLPTANSDILDSKQYGSFEFEQPLHPLNLKTRPGLQETLDYEFISKQMYETLASCSDYDMIAVPRNVVATKDGKKVQIDFFKFNVIIMYNTICRIIQNSEGMNKPLQVTFQYSHYAKVKQFSENILKYIKEEARIKRLGDLDSKQPLRLWLLPADTDKNILFNSFQQGCKANPSFEYRLYLQAQLLEADKQLIDYDITDTSYLIAQLRQQKRSWIFYNNKKTLESACNSCREVKQLKFICACKYAAYCSDQCRQKDKLTHRSRCPNDAESQKQDMPIKLTQQSNKGLTGLRNLGNTCFMNSGLQCVSHIKQLIDYFLQNKYVQDINKQNLLGTKGQLSTAFCKLIQSMWFGNETSYSPSQLKKAIGKYQPMFTGFNQHDSGELINFLLDGLHQDLNRIKQKPYVQSKDYDNLPDNVVANEAWSQFLKRNQSIIVDLMYGQYKSILDCPKCKNISVQFDPFLMVSLPINDSKKRTIEIVFIRNHIEEIRLTINYQIQQKVTLDYALQQVKSKFKLAEQSKLIAYSASTSSCEIVKVNAELEELRRQSAYRTLYVRELILDEDPSDDSQVFLTNVIAYSATQQTNRKSILPGRLYLFNNQLTYKQVHKRIYSYYHQFYPIADYQTQVINQEPQNQPFRILYIPTSYYSPCQNCEKTKCYGCPLKYTDDKFAPEKKPYNKIEIQLFWRSKDKYIQEQMQQLRQQEKQSTRKLNPGIKIEDCFAMFQQPQILGEENAWYCPKCKQFVQAKKQMQIYKAPKILILCLKRFRRKEYHTEKYNILVNYPIQGLDLSNYVINHNLPEVFMNSKHQSNMSEKPVYDLIAVSNHMGSTGGGHYTAYGKDIVTNEWWEFDDSYISKVKDVTSIVSQSGYVLFYRRRQ